MAQIPQFPGMSPLAPGQTPEPLTPEQLSQITHARYRYKKIRRMLSVAGFDAWCTAIFSGISLIGSVISFSIPGILLGLGMGVCSYNSFQGLSKLERLDTDGARILGRNQLLLGAFLLLYAVWNFIVLASGKANLGLSAQDQDLLSQAGLGGTSDLLQLCYYAVYGGVAGFALIVQPLTALYYSSRKKLIVEYREKTAEWVLQMQQSGFKL